MNGTFQRRIHGSTRWSRLLLVVLLGLLSASRLLAMPAGACAAGEGYWGGGPPNDAERWSDVSEDLLVVGAGAELVVFDIATPAAPVELGRVVIGHPATSVTVSADGQMAAASDWFDNVTLIDISNRGDPALRGSHVWPGIQQPTGMAFDGNYLFVAVRTIGLAVLDISDPDAPTLVANSDGSVTDYVFDVAVRGNHAYLGQGDDGVQVVDISNPNDPAVVGNVSAWTGAGQIDIVGDRAYVARGSNGFGILGLTNPAAPVALGGYDTVGYTYETALLPGGRLAVADGFDGTSVFDISTPASPVELGTYDSDPYRLVALDERVFLVAGQGMAPQIRLVNFQSPVAPAVLANIDFDGQSVAVSVGAGHAMVANSSGGLVMLDTTNPAQPAYIGRVDINAQRVDHVNGYAVVSAGYDSTISVIDPQGSGPVVVSTIDVGAQTNDLVGDGDWLYVASGEFGGLRIFDMSNPLAPQFAGAYTAPGVTVWQVAVAGNFAYVGYGNVDTLHVIDVSNPGAPVEISDYVLPPAIYAGPTDMDASGDYLYVGTQVNGVRVLQNDGAGNLDEIASIDVSLASVTGVSVDGDRLHVSGGVYSGLLIYDISDPADPQFVEQYNTDGEGIGVDAANGVIAMAEGRSGASTFGCDESADLLFRDGFE